ncbi:hypothetical protein BVI2075_960016 [Burkholderia vietnamiensis]|nr:hypothetical protein BVI2075_960016 [Burkholderia vietnamiensis]
MLRIDERSAHGNSTPYATITVQRRFVQRLDLERFNRNDLDLSRLRLFFCLFVHKGDLQREVSQL